MPDINWGVLQPLQQMAPVHSAAPQASGGSAPLLSPGAGDNSLAEQQKIGLDTQRLQMELAQQPGILKHQQLENEGLLQTNKKNSLDLITQERSVKSIQNADIAYSQAKKGGASHEQALDAFEDQLTPEQAQSFQLTRDNHRQSVINNNATSISNAAGVVAQTQQLLQQAKNDPAMQQKLINNADKSLDRIDPDHPKIKTKEDLNLYSVATLGTLMNPKVQAQMTFELKKAKIQAEAKSNADITTDAIKTANADAGKASILASDATSAMNADKAIQDWNTKNPDKAVNIGPGFTGWKKAKEMVAAAGGPVGALDQMEQFQAKTDKQIADTITSLKTMPRSAPIIDALTKSLAQPSDTAGARMAKYQAAIYASKYKSTYADFLGDYKDVNGSLTGAQTAWGNFVASDPDILHGKSPNPDYLSPDSYKPYLNRDYKPPKTSISSKQTVTPTTNNSNITADQAKAELVRRGVIKQ